MPLELWLPEYLLAEDTLSLEGEDSPGGLYNALGVPRTAPAPEIGAALAQLETVCQPQITGDPMDCERLFLARFAGTILGDKKLRELYDAGKLREHIESDTAFRWSELNHSEPLTARDVHRWVERRKTQQDEQAAVLAKRRAAKAASGKAAVGKASPC